MSPNAEARDVKGKEMEMGRLHHDVSVSGKTHL